MPPKPGGTLRAGLRAPWSRRRGFRQTAGGSRGSHARLTACSRAFRGLTRCGLRQFLPRPPLACTRAHARGACCARHTGIRNRPATRRCGLIFRGAAWRALRIGASRFAWWPRPHPDRYGHRRFACRSGRGGVQRAGPPRRRLLAGLCARLRFSPSPARRAPAIPPIAAPHNARGPGVARRGGARQALRVTTRPGPHARRSSADDAPSPANPLSLPDPFTTPYFLLFNIHNDNHKHRHSGRVTHPPAASFRARIQARRSRRLPPIPDPRHTHALHASAACMRTPSLHRPFRCTPYVRASGLATGPAALPPGSTVAALRDGHRRAFRSGIAAEGATSAFLTAQVCSSAAGAPAAAFQIPTAGFVSPFLARHWHAHGLSLAARAAHAIPESGTGPPRGVAG